MSGVRAEVKLLSGWGYSWAWEEMQAAFRVRKWRESL